MMKKNIKRVMKGLALTAQLLALLLVSNLAAAAESKTPLSGDAMPLFQLEVPQDPMQKSYLGLTSNTTFPLLQVKGEVLIVEILSMYCPHCQREAPRINSFYEKIERDAALKDRVKLIGIGVGNSAFEIAFFRKTYQVPFPLFADPDFVIHKQLGEVRTQYFFGVRLSGPEAGRVFYSRLGGPDDALAFLDQLLENAGL